MARKVAAHRVGIVERIEEILQVSVRTAPMAFVQGRFIVDNRHKRLLVVAKFFDHSGQLIVEAAIAPEIAGSDIGNANGRWWHCVRR